MKIVRDYTKAHSLFAQNRTRISAWLSACVCQPRQELITMKLVRVRTTAAIFLFFGMMVPVVHAQHDGKGDQQGKPDRQQGGSPPQQQHAQQPPQQPQRAQQPQQQRAQQPQQQQRAPQPQQQQQRAQQPQRQQQQRAQQPQPQQQRAKQPQQPQPQQRAQQSRPQQQRDPQTPARTRAAASPTHCSVTGRPVPGGAVGVWPGGRVPVA